ncbi:uncharacterized protein LOC134690434 [Mytilus trossulus]|uniref:uncharacterized protein LOC134690434 n=1 Tax=Mytilus trossulus TaxID=6551 RepID=UPI003004D6F7
MKVAWILLLSLFLVFLLEDCEAWRRRRFRIRIRVRRFTRKVLPRIRGRRLIRKIGHIIKGTIKTITRVAVLNNPWLFFAKQVYDRYKAKKMQGKLSGQQTCVADDVCGGSCIKSECMWYCDNVCNIMADDKFNWRGDLVELPCKYSAYDYSGAGYFYPSDLAFHIKERGRERDNMMVFRRLDQNGDGRVSASEFSITKKYLLIDQETC